MSVCFFVNNIDIFVYIFYYNKISIFIVFIIILIRSNYFMIKSVLMLSNLTGYCSINGKHNTMYKKLISISSSIYADYLHFIVIFHFKIFHVLYKLNIIIRFTIF